MTMVKESVKALSGLVAALESAKADTQAAKDASASLKAKVARVAVAACFSNIADDVAKDAKAALDKRWRDSGASSGYSIGRRVYNYLATHSRLDVDPTEQEPARVFMLKRPADDNGASGVIYLSDYIDGVPENGLSLASLANKIGEKEKVAKANAETRAAIDAAGVEALAEAKDLPDAYKGLTVSEAMTKAMLSRDKKTLERIAEIGADAKVKAENAAALSAAIEAFQKALHVPGFADAARDMLNAHDA